MTLNHNLFIFQHYVETNIRDPQKVNLLPRQTLLAILHVSP